MVTLKNKVEQHGGRSKVDRLGYVPLQRRIKQLMQAGTRLENARANAFDFQEDIGDLEDLPTFPIYRDIGADITDVYVAKREVDERMKRRVKELSALNAAKRKTSVKAEAGPAGQTQTHPEQDAKG